MKKKLRFHPLGSAERTSRGFGIIKFKDHYGASCSLQESSLSSPALWLGVDDADPKVMWKDAEALGIKPEVTEGWVKYPVPKSVMLSTRMHLNRQQVESLVASLQLWLENETIIHDL